MSEYLQIRVATLRAAVEHLLDGLEEMHGPVIPLSHDYFWVIDSEQKYDPYSEPASFTLGQVSECVTNLQGIADEPSNGATIGISWAGQVMEAIGHEFY